MTWWTEAGRGGEPWGARHRRLAAGALLAACALLLAGVVGCGVYSATSGRLDPALRRVAVPVLENLSSEPNIEIELTDSIIQALQADNTLQVVAEKDADTVLSGRVLGYRLKEAFTGQNLQVDQYQVQILVELTMTKKANGAKLFDKKHITGTGNYILNDPNGSTEAGARSDAAKEIVRGVLALIVEDW
jgi:hypothetical protein